MDNITLNRFKELLSVPSKTYQEDKMVEYLSWVLDSMDGVEYYTDEMNNIYATKRQDGFNGYFPMFVAHTDTVHAMVPEIVVKEQTLPKPPTFGRTFDDTQYDVLKAYTPDGNPTGIGGDDKAGIFICLSLIEQFDNIMGAFFVEEEIGCNGSREAKHGDGHSYLEQAAYFIQFDAPTDNWISRVCNNVELFNDEFEMVLKPVWKLYELSEPNINDPITDVKELKLAYPVCCINYFAGYMDMHTPVEYVVIEYVEKALNVGASTIIELGVDKYLYKNK